MGEAPGRLDFLGGVADYSGSLVLEMPIASVTRVTIRAQAEPTLELASAQEGRWALPLAALAGAPEKPAALRAWLDARGAPHWARYAAGCFLLFARHWRWRPETGLVFKIESRVPASMGVSSSAALEVATLRALEQFAGKRFAGTALARLAQRAENEIVGAPCGLMDQLASAYGARGALLPILCRPDILAAPVRLPRGAIAVGWPSGVKHAVSASPYATARAAAFMGKKLVEAATGGRRAHATEWSPSFIRGVGARALPEKITGRAFLRRCGGVDDALSRIDPRETYGVRAGLLFPVEENFRARLAVALLRGAAAKTRGETLRALGELLYQSHAGYSSIGLGCPETDAMAAAVRALGPARGFYGARVSGGGSGGTVVVLLEQSARLALRALSRKICFRAEGALPLIG